MLRASDERIASDTAVAGRMVSDYISRDSARRVDLEEALEASRYASHPYSSPPKEWPPSVEIANTRDLPAVLIDRYNAAGGEGTALCGIFPEIRRAWASVDNSLFLWRFDKWDGQCPEYSGEEQAICAVGLAKAKPGIFVEAIQYLLVLATPVELILLGICCSPSGDGEDPYAEIALQPLPEYTIPSDGVTMTCIACTDKGQIFLAGRDGHLYEMQYSSGSGWRKRCRKICHTASVGGLISRWVLPNVLKFGAVDPIIGMVVDNERSVLYARTQESKILVFDLGIDGDGSPKKIAEERNLIDQRDGLYGGVRSATSRVASRASKTSIIYIGPLSTLESKRLHLVAVLSDGRRMYLSTASSGGNSDSIGGLPGLSNALHRPCSLKVVSTRSSPSVGVGTLPLAGRPHSEDLALKVETAYYSCGLLVLSDSSPPAMSSLLVVNRDPSAHSSSFGAAARHISALRETVSSLPVEGRMLYVADVLPLPDTAAMLQSLYLESYGMHTFGKSCERASVQLWALGDLATQHILPRRRAVMFSTMGMTEIVLNRPVDILRRLLEFNASRSSLEDFFNRFGAGEAAAMCLLLASKLLSFEEILVSNSVAEKAAEAFEDPRLVGLPQVEGSSAVSNAVTPPGVGFNMGQVVQEAEPTYSGAHEGLCLCTARLLSPLWELPVMIMKGSGSSETNFPQGVITCRLSFEGMEILESKIRSLEQFLRSRRNQRRGLYGCVAGFGDLTGSILYGTGLGSGTSEDGARRNLYNNYAQSINADRGTVIASKRPRLPYSPAELAALEVRGMECLRRLLRRSGEALFLLRLLVQHQITRLIQSLDVNLRLKLVQLTFQQLVCSEEGEQLATRLIAALMEYYIGPDGRGTLDDISSKLKEGCPSYYNESDNKFFQAVEFLERAAITGDADEREKLAKEAFGLLAKVPESADLGTVCKRFEDLRFYEAVVRLPLQKAQALDPEGDALNDQIDANRREQALILRQQCYDIVTNALRSLKGETVQKGAQIKFGSASRVSGKQALDQASRDKYIRQIVQLGVQSTDKAFHEHLYRSMIDLGLENELLEFGGPDLVPFLQNAGREPLKKVEVVTTPPSLLPQIGHEKGPIPSHQVKYIELLARYYVLKRQHMLAALVLMRLAERQSADVGETLTLEQRQQYLSNAVLQAKSARSTAGPSSYGSPYDSGLLDLLEGKLAVLRFQIKIKGELEALASKLEDPSGLPRDSAPDDAFPQRNLIADVNLVSTARSKARELALDLKSITQLYNDYAVPFELWEICLEIIHFANYSEDSNSSIIREIWARLLDQAISKGGVAEACQVLKRVGSQFYPGEGASLPLDTICLHLEKVALDRAESGVESVGDEDVARALLGACKGAAEPLLNTYDQLLSNGAILPSPNLRLRLLRSVLVILRDWEVSIVAQRMGTSSTGAKLIYGGLLTSEQTTAINQGIRDKIVSAANRYMTEVRRLALPSSTTDEVYRGFRELEEKLLSPFF
ncbi:nuclear pore complex protein NUP155 [Nymphaea colorata]|nr:nuclear pore complex protein NUP155 [Nymphaea colorata]